MDIRYFVDPETGSPHIYEHGVTEDDVEDVLRRPIEERPGRDGSRVAVGRTEAGRYLIELFMCLIPFRIRFSSSPDTRSAGRP